MTSAMPKIGLPASSLDEGRRAETISQLNAGLANMLDLTLCAKQAHWNIRGPNFQGLHELFDIIAAESRTWSDSLAERLVTLGGTAHGTSQDIISGSKIGNFPTDEHRWMNLCREMHSRMLKCAEQLRNFANELDDELITQDLVIEIVRGLEMRSWMVAAHLDQQQS